MGAWGPGLQANDTALDAIHDQGLDGEPGGLVDHILHGSTDVVRGVFDAIPDWGNEATLGVADRLLDLGVDLREFADELMPLVEEELSEEQLGRWSGREDRAAALRNFARRLKGEQVPAEELELDNLGLFARMGRSNDELKRIIDERQ